jgi:hypothetical protein
VPLGGERRSREAQQPRTAHSQGGAYDPRNYGGSGADAGGGGGNGSEDRGLPPPQVSLTVMGGSAAAPTAQAEPPNAAHAARAATRRIVATRGPARRAWPPTRTVARGGRGKGEWMGNKINGFGYY